MAAPGVAPPGVATPDLPSPKPTPPPRTTNRRPPQPATQPGLFGASTEAAPVADAPLLESVAQEEAAPVFRLEGVQSASGAKGKARDLLAALRLLKLLEGMEGEGRITSDEEKRILARFPGFGALANEIFPDPATGAFKPGWETLGGELQELLSTEEYASAKRSTYNAFYTAQPVMQAIYAALAGFGVPAKGTRALEPGCAVGNFIGMAPPSMEFVGVEMETLSGRIARQLYPEANIRIEDFGETPLPEGSVDVVVGNVPFADLKRTHQGQKLPLHDYFFAKSLDGLREGGILALVTSRFTLDKLDPAFRDYLNERADFLGAIRLPTDAFKQEGTQVVTDILFLAKGKQQERSQLPGNAWLDTALLDEEHSSTRYNRYFAEHPEMVVGTLSTGRGLYQEHELRVEPPGAGLEAALREAVQQLPQGFYTPRQQPLAEIPKQREASSDRPLAAGSFFVDDKGYIMQVMDKDGGCEPVLHGQKRLHALSGKYGQRLAGLIEIRDAARAVLATQTDERPALERELARQKLNHRYDRFVSLWGPINLTSISTRADGRTLRRMPNVAKFTDDPDAYLVMALERYDERDGRVEKMPILLHDVIGPAETVQHVESALDGLLVSLNERGRVDIEYIGQLYEQSPERVVEELGGRIFFDPVQETYVTAEEYLSGNVRRKLAEARAAEGDPRCGANVAALEEAQPEDVLPGDIDPNLGAGWIPTDVVRHFAAELLECRESALEVDYVAKDALWHVKAERFVRWGIPAQSTFGTAKRDAVSLLNDALNLRSPTLYELVSDGEGGEKRVVDQTATLAAREKLATLKERFRGWVFGEPERTDRLVRLYNDTFNSDRLRSYDGAHLTFPGMNPEIALRPHQVNAVWRTMTDGNTLLAHVVGAGKTFEMIAAGIKLKQTGLARKTLFVVPNHMLEQFSREFYLLYPNANLLVANKEDLSASKRKLFTAKVTSGDWDGVIMTHSSFSKIGMSPAYQATFMREQVADYENLLTDMKLSADGETKRLIKQVEKKKQAWEEKLERLLNAESKDAGLTFEEMGVDCLFVDEAHLFKNLETPTKMDRVAGVQTQGSQRAFDLFIKARYLGEQTPGRGVVFATGTPISNSMVEMYTLQRFLNPEALAERGIGHFDAWASVFGDIVEAVELSPDGNSLRSNRRFAQFVNLPELLQMFHQFADVKTAAMLDLPCPAIRGGAAAVVACPMSETQRAWQASLVRRYERVRSGGVEPREDNALKITTDGRKLALDVRLVAEGAGDFAESKVNALVENVHEIWRETAAQRATQMIFCDLGVSGKDGRHSVYADVIAKLEAAGVPAGEIANIGDYNTDAKKEQLFERVRKGDVRVLLGSTAKMGTGTNVQERLIALHHLDAPWKPAEVEQRDGRMLRQGNTNPEVRLFRYVTENSFDAYMWQTLETKAGFINQVMAGETSLRRMQDVNEQTLSYAEVKAIASGNPAMMTLAQMEMEMQRLSRLKRAHADEQYRLRQQVREVQDGELPRQAGYLRRLEADMATVEAYGGSARPHMVIEGQEYQDPARAQKALKETVLRVWDELADQLMPLPPGHHQSAVLGSFAGLNVVLRLEKDSKRISGSFGLKGEMVHRQTLRGPGSDRLLGYLQGMAEGLVERRAEATETQREARERVAALEAQSGQPFAQDGRLKALAEIQTLLQAALQEQGDFEQLQQQHIGSPYLEGVLDKPELTVKLVQAFEAWGRGEGVQNAPEPVLLDAVRQEQGTEVGIRMVA